MLTHAPTQRLLAGPPLDGRAESLAAHHRRLGPLPALPARQMVAALETTGLLGRGGAGFPVGRKWRAISERTENGTPVVVANGAEGEPESAKDRFLMTHRPHLIIDGAILAAGTLGADRVELYLGREHTSAVRAMRVAVSQRHVSEQKLLHVVEAPIGYVAGESTAVVHYVNSKDARPLMTPPRMSERGVRNRPTLVQNVESLAYSALIARYGPDWFRERGRGNNRGTALVTVAGPVRNEGVVEIDLGTPLAEVVELAGGLTGTPQAVLIGGYFGTWTRIDSAWNLPLDPESLKAAGLTLGCGLVRLLDARACGVDYSARIMAFLAAGSAMQCGPCRYGLADLASASGRVAAMSAGPDDLYHIDRWTGLVTGRGACRHPDGAAQQMSTAMTVFADDFASHAEHRRCLAGAHVGGVR
ncbi:MAG TPA: NADH-ubiquinone oxidoreductase-F iron-sulfur binding region domain-containing protein [Candidatus Limnocylindrales bacterium]